MKIRLFVLTLLVGALFTGCDKTSDELFATAETIATAESLQAGQFIGNVEKTDAAVGLELEITGDAFIVMDNVIRRGVGVKGPVVEQYEGTGIAQFAIPERQGGWWLWWDKKSESGNQLGSIFQVAIIDGAGERYVIEDPNVTSIAMNELPGPVTVEVAGINHEWLFRVFHRETS